MRRILTAAAFATLLPLAAAEARGSGPGGSSSPWVDCRELSTATFAFEHLAQPNGAVRHVVTVTLGGAVTLDYVLAPAPGAYRNPGGTARGRLEPGGQVRHILGTGFLRQSDRDGLSFVCARADR